MGGFSPDRLTLFSLTLISMVVGYRLKISKYVAASKVIDKIEEYIRREDYHDG